MRVPPITKYVLQGQEYFIHAIERKRPENQRRVNATVDSGVPVDIGRDVEGLRDVGPGVEVAKVMPGTEEGHHGRSHGRETFREMGHRHGDKECTESMAAAFQI